MTFEKVREIIVEQLSVDESMVTMDTNLMKDLEADSLKKSLTLKSPMKKLRSSRWWGISLSM